LTAIFFVLQIYFKLFVNYRVISSQNKIIMKKYFLRIVMMVVIGLSFSAAADAQIVVKVRPAAPVFRAKPFRPSPAHVWVGGNYIWRGGQYIYTDGYWASPRPGFRWVEGHWKHRRGGWVWIPGHWRR